MKKLNTEEQEKVEIAREAIANLQNAQSVIYEQLSNEIGWDNDWLYDYVYNCSEEDSYASKVRGEIFE